MIRMWAGAPELLVVDGIVDAAIGNVDGAAATTDAVDISLKVLLSSQKVREWQSIKWVASPSFCS